MRILLTMNLPLVPAHGGANLSNRLLLEQLAARGHDVHAVTPAQPALGKSTLDALMARLEAAGCTSLRVSGPSLCAVRAGVHVTGALEPGHLRRVLADEIERLQPDAIVVSTEDPSHTLLTTGLNLRPARVVYLVQTMSFLPFGPLSFFPSQKRAAVVSRVPRIVAASHCVAGYLREWGGLQSTVVYLPQYGSGPWPKVGGIGNPFVLMGNPCAVKGIAILLAMADRLPHIAFAAVPTWGTTPDDRAALEARPNITVLPPFDDIDALFTQARALLMPSLWNEGMPMMVVQAMLRGVPVLASNSLGNVEAKLGTELILPAALIERFTDTLDANLLPVPVIPPQDVTPWCDALARLLADPAYFTAHADDARRRAETFVRGLDVRPFETVLEAVASGADTGDRPAGRFTPLTAAS